MKIKKLCPHPGRFHLAVDQLTIVSPHPQADTCFARSQGYVIARIEPAYKSIATSIVEAMNRAEMCMWSTPDRRCLLPNGHGGDHVLPKQEE